MGTAGGFGTEVGHKGRGSHDVRGEPGSRQAIKLMLATQEWKADYFKVGASGKHQKILVESRKNQVANTTQQYGTKCRSCKQPCDMKMKQSVAFSFERDLTCREKHRHKCCSHISCIPLCQVGPVSDDQVFEDLKYQAYVHAFPVQTSDASTFCIFFNFWQIKYDFLGPAAFAHNFSWIGLPLRYGVVYFCGRDYGLRLNTLQNEPASCGEAKKSWYFF